MPSVEDISEQIELLSAHRRTLALYLKQQATLGETFTPTSIIYGIDDSRQNIQRIKENLRHWGVSVEDSTLDEPIDLGTDSDHSVAIVNAITESINSDVQINSTSVDNYLKTVENITIQFMSTIRSEMERLTRVSETLQSEVDRLRDIIQPIGSVEDEQDIREELQHQSLLKKELIKRLRILEIEQARKGIDAPPQTEIQIHDIKERITEIDARIKILNYDLENYKKPRKKA